MSGLNATTHGSQDFYPTFLRSQLGMVPRDVTIVTVVGQLGAAIGAGTIGYISTFAGRRLTMMTAAVFGGAILPAYIIPHSKSLAASAFFEQFFVLGIWGMCLFKQLQALNLNGECRTYRNSPYGTLATSITISSSRLDLSTRESCFIGFGNHPSHHWGTVSFTTLGHRGIEVRLRQSDRYLHGCRMGI